MKITIMKKAAFVFCTLLMAGCFNEGVDPARITAFTVSSSETATDGSPLIEVGASGDTFFNVDWTVDASPYKYELYLNDSPDLQGNEILLEKDVCGQGASYTCGLRRVIRCYSDDNIVDEQRISSMTCDNGEAEDGNLIKQPITSLVNSRANNLFIVFKACNGQEELCRVASDAVTLSLKPRVSVLSITPDELFEQGGQSVVSWTADQISSNSYFINLELVETKADAADVKVSIFTAESCNDSNSCGATTAEAGKYFGRLECAVTYNGSYNLKCSGGDKDSNDIDITTFLNFDIAADTSKTSLDVSNFIRNLRLTVCDTDTVSAESCNAYDQQIKIIQDRPLVTLATLPVIPQGGSANIHWQTRTAEDVYEVVAVEAVTAVAATETTDAVAGVDAVEAVAASFPDYEFKLFESDLQDFLSGAASTTQLTALTCAGTSAGVGIGKACGDADVPATNTRIGLLSCALDAAFNLSCNGGAQKDLAGILPLLPYEASAIPVVTHYLIAQSCKTNSDTVNVNLCTHQSELVSLGIDMPEIKTFSMTDTAESPSSKATLTANDTSAHDNASADKLKLTWDLDIKPSDGTNAEAYTVNVYVRGQNTAAELLGSDGSITRAQFQALGGVISQECTDDNCSATDKSDGSTQYGELDCTLSVDKTLKCGAADALDISAHIVDNKTYLFLEACNKAAQPQCRYKASAQLTIQ